MKTIVVIPARYASTRLPGKPLVDIAGKTMIHRVYEQVSQSKADMVFVATDDQRIVDEVKSFGGEVMLTNIDHKSGTDRCYEVLSKVGKPFDVLVNVQGDEPFVQPQQINSLIDVMQAGHGIATLSAPIRLPEEVSDENVVKVVFDKNMNALYFSRHAMPFLRGKEKSTWAKNHTYFKHIGMYAFQTDVMRELVALPQSDLELAESLEQLRWLENGFDIHVELTLHDNFSIDTQTDLENAIKMLQTETKKN